MEELSFYSGPPPFVGWWNASVVMDADEWHWWNGKHWSTGVTSKEPMAAVLYAADTQSLLSELLEWSWRWPPQSTYVRSGGFHCGAHWATVRQGANDLSVAFSVGHVDSISAGRKMLATSSFDPPEHLKELLRHYDAKIRARPVVRSTAVEDDDYEF